MDFDIREMLLRAPGILFGFTIHEFAHAWTAWRLGDDTAAREGRLTLNPLMHLDWMGTLLIFLAGFGWARPVPINPARFRHPRRDDLLVTLAGPVSNLVTAAILALGVRFIPGVREVGSLAATLGQVLLMAVYMNLLLCFFNLLPIFPLDGARVVRALLPLNQAFAFSRLERIGPMLLLLVIAAGPAFGFDLMGRVLGPPIHFFLNLLL